MKADIKGVKVLFNFGASGDLVRQIAAGAPVDSSGLPWPGHSSGGPAFSSLMSPFRPWIIPCVWNCKNF